LNDRKENTTCKKPTAAITNDSLYWINYSTADWLKNQK